jgi:hypothetical protein
MKSNVRKLTGKKTLDTDLKITRLDFEDVLHAYEAIEMLFLGPVDYDIKELDETTRANMFAMTQLLTTTAGWDTDAFEEARSEYIENMQSCENCDENCDCDCHDEVKKDEPKSN